MIVEIDALDPVDGFGEALAGGRRVRVERVLPGERVGIELPDGSREPRERLAARVFRPARIVQPSPHRVGARCPFFGPCGGCTWQHIAYAEQLRLKQAALQALLVSALGPAAPRVAPTLPPIGEPWGYRDKVHFVFAPESRRGGLQIGHYRRSSRSVIPVDACPVHAEAGNRVAFAAFAALRSAGIDGAGPDLRGIARHIVVRVSEATGETLATLVVTANARALRPAVETLLRERPGAGGAGRPDGLHLDVHDRPGPFLFSGRPRRIAGVSRVREAVGGASFLLSPESFFQTSVRSAEVMVHVVLEAVGTPDRALDLYAGAGLFALPLARAGASVVAVEESADAIADGEASRALSRVPGSSCRFVRARAEDRAGGRLRRALDPAPDLVVLDPPRQGCPIPVLQWITRDLRPARIVYVSCSPVRLAADLGEPLKAGYRVRLVQPIDMFPHTAHIEAVAVLEDVGRRT